MTLQAPVVLDRQGQKDFSVLIFSNILIKKYVCFYFLFSSYEESVVGMSNFMLGPMVELTEIRFI